MNRSLKAAGCLVLLLASGLGTQARSADDLYVSQAIVTGTGEKNRQPGFRDCLDRVLVRVSGDQRLLQRPELADLHARAGSLVQSFSYHDRLAGRPVHDEQGTHDRPHDLTCHYDRGVLDHVLAGLGSRPWLDKRPVLAVFLEVQRGGKDYRVNSEDGRDDAMRISFAQAASPMAMKVVFPTAKASAVSSTDPSFAKAVKEAGADLPLTGTLTWSDADLGWVVTWHLSQGGKDHEWRARGVSFDEAFRVGVRGAAQIFSGNGEP